MRNTRLDEYAGYHDEMDDIAGLHRPQLLPHLVLLLILVGGSLVAVHYFGGPRMFEQSVRSLFTPVGSAWFFLALASYWVLVRRIRLAIFLSWTSLIVLTLGGNAYIANRLISQLERPYAHIDPFQMDKLDSIVVLGGCTDTTPAGVPQLGLMGDRLVLAARLFHAGKVDRILVTGLRDRQPGDQGLQLYEEAAQILAGLNVPQENIVPLDLGSDTSEEIQGIKRWLSENNVVRIGIVTSAWHMKRALILAARYDVRAVPVPANFLGESVRMGPGVVIPGAMSLYVTQLAAKEYAGRWLDR